MGKEADGRVLVCSAVQESKIGRDRSIVRLGLCKDRRQVMLALLFWLWKHRCQREGTEEG